MADLILVVGPIGAGKSTASRLLAVELESHGRSTAVVDLDDVVFMQGTDLDGIHWQRGREVHSSLVSAWIRSGVDAVIAHGPIVTSGEMADFMRDIPADVS